MTKPLLTEGREMVDAFQENIRQGNCYTAFWINEDSAPVSDNGLFGLVIQTRGRKAYLNLYVAGGGDTEAALIENPTLTATGTPTTIYNLNRAMAAQGSNCLAWHSPTVATGTYLGHNLLPAGWANATPGGQVRAGSEWLLNSGTFYALVGVNRGGGNQPGSVVAQWHESD